MKLYGALLGALDDDVTEGDDLYVIQLCQRGEVLAGGDTATADDTCFYDTCGSNNQNLHSG